MNSSVKLLLAAFTLIVILGCTPSSFTVPPIPPDPLTYMDYGRVFDYALKLESLTLDQHVSLYTYRSAGSAGANAATYWIANVLQEFGLKVWIERFHFLTWELLDQPSLTLYVDSKPMKLRSFTPLHWSWPTPPEGLRKGITVYSDHCGEVEDRILVVGVDEMAIKGELTNFFNWIKAHRPSAVVYTYFLPGNMWMPYISNSAEGRIYWDIEAPACWMLYNDWVKVRGALNVSDRVEAEIKIPARISIGPHYNVVGELEGLHRDKTLIVSAHYDTVMSPGFVDNGAGVAAVLTLAKAFSEAHEAGFKPPFNIRFILFTAEELGLLGSLNYISEHKTELNRIIGVVNLDSIGGLRLKVVKSSSILDEVALDAAEELNVPNTENSRLFGFTNVRSLHQTAADHLSFEDPETACRLAQAEWPDLSLSVDPSIKVPAITISSRPVFSSYLRTEEQPGWIHTPYDNSTTLGWVDQDRLDSHTKVSALTVIKAMNAATIQEQFNSFILGSFQPLLAEKKLMLIDSIHLGEKKLFSFIRS